MAVGLAATATLGVEVPFAPLLDLLSLDFCFGSFVPLLLAAGVALVEPDEWGANGPTQPPAASARASDSPAIDLRLSTCSPHPVFFLLEQSWVTCSCRRQRSAAAVMLCKVRLSRVRTVAVAGTAGLKRA